MGFNSAFKRLTQKLMMADTWRTKGREKRARRKSYSLHRLQLERFNTALLWIFTNSQVRTPAYSTQ